MTKSIPQPRTTFCTITLLPLGTEATVKMDPPVRDIIHFIKDLPRGQWEWDPVGYQWFIKPPHLTRLVELAKESYDIVRWISGGRATEYRKPAV